MKRIVSITAAAIFVFASCTSNPPATSSKGTEEQSSVSKDVVDFSVISSEVWKLTEIRTENEIIAVQRAADQADLFTLEFKEGHIYGKAAPNRYNGPYTNGEDESLTIGNAASTLMMGVNMPARPTEAEYFAYLSKVSHYKIDEQTFALYSKDEAGKEVILLFLPLIETDVEGSPLN
ncbi:MAG: META domain-containing protein [Spirochaetaceae bacterium]|jgi:heat shock protein HslJ|nr:META domain-containing protein [Spirochaetaceae bacterium]